METADSDTSMGQARCPQCGNHLPVHALAGLCPACLLGQGACETQANTAVSAFVPPSIEEIAPLFPNLEILELIGRGGMGAVYKAHQTALDRTVALKILPSATSHDPAFSERFTREARALAKLNHPGIVTLYESGRAGDLCFFLMEFVDGVNLRQILTGDRLSTREALAIVPRICDALQYAHDQGIVHRDIKPENILLDRLGNVKIADFGLAKLVGPELQSLSNTTGTSEFTIAGNLMGTPAYMAPEQMDHPSGVDHRADIYALGVVIYQMLTGELPDQPLVPPSRTMQIDVRLDEVVVRALQRKPELRFQQADDLKTMIEEISKSTHAMTARPRSKRLIGIPGTLLVLCLPLSIVIPVVSRQKKPEMHHTAALFASRNPGDRQLVEDLLKSSLGGFPGVSLKRNRTRDQWSIELAGEDREKIQDQMTELVYFVTGALDGTSDDPLTEPARFESFQTISDSVGSWTTNRTFVSTLRSWSLAGSVFSAFGLLLLTFPRRPFSTPIARIPGIVALGLLVLGCYAAFSLRLHGIMHREVLVAAILTGVLALLLGIAGHSDRFGRIVAAFAWLGILLAGRDVFLSLPPPSAPERWINIPLTADAVAPPRKARFLTERIRSKGSAVSSWLEQIDAGNYSEPWNLLSNATQSLESQATWTDRTRAIRTSLGDLVTRKLVQSATTWQGEKAAEEQILTYTFQSSFTLRSEVRETVILGLQRDGKWRISGYFIK